MIRRATKITELVLVSLSQTSNKYLPTSSLGTEAQRTNTRSMSTIKVFKRCLRILFVFTVTGHSGT